MKYLVLIAVLLTSSGVHAASCPVVTSKNLLDHGESTSQWYLLTPEGFDRDYVKGHPDRVIVKPRFSYADPGGSYCYFSVSIPSWVPWWPTEYTVALYQGASPEEFDYTSREISLGGGRYHVVLKCEDTKVGETCAPMTFRQDTKVLLINQLQVVMTGLNKWTTGPNSREYRRYFQEIKTNLQICRKVFDKSRLNFKGQLDVLHEYSTKAYKGMVTVAKLAREKKWDIPVKDLDLLERDIKSLADTFEGLYENKSG